MIKKILSLDMSSTCTGYSKFEYNLETKDFKLVEVSSIKPKGTSLYQRIENLHNTFNLKELYTWPDEVVFENYSFAGNRVSQLAELNGIIKFQYHLNTVPIEVIAPTTIKKQVTGSGRAKKDEVRKALAEVDELRTATPKNHDESDSMAVGYSYIKKLNEYTDGNK